MAKRTPPTGEKPSLRAERRRLREGLSRTQFLDAAEEIFGRKGFHDTTLKEVAEQAEFSVGSVYTFFQSKDDLMCQIFLRRGEESIAGLQEVFASGGTEMQRLHRIADFEIDFFRKHPHFGRLSLRYLNADVLILEEGIIQQAIADNYAEVVRLHAALFEQGQNTGECHDGDPEALARMWLGLINTYHSIDPAVVGDDSTPERFPRHDLHDLIERAFGR